jgi:hypothetical protein
VLKENSSYLQHVQFFFNLALIGAYICLRALSWHLGAFPNEFLYPKQYQLKIIGVVKW